MSSLRGLEGPTRTAFAPVLLEAALCARRAAGDRETVERAHHPYGCYG
jgi:hypothetical protein